MIEISFEPSSVRNGPRSLLAYFPRGRPRLTTQAYVRAVNLSTRVGQSLTLRRWAWLQWPIEQVFALRGP